MILSDLVGSSEKIQGIRSVFGMVEGSYLGFSNLDRAKEIVERSITSPYVLCVGAQNSVSSCAECVVNIVEIGKEVVELDAENMPLHHWAALKKRWPLGIVLKTVFLIEEFPHLKNDLGFKRTDFIHVSQGLNCTDRDQIRDLFAKLSNRSVVRVPVPPAGEGATSKQRLEQLQELT